MHDKIILSSLVTILHIQVSHQHGGWEEVIVEVITVVLYWTVYECVMEVDVHYADWNIMV